MKKFVVGFAVMALALGVAVSASAQTTSVADLQAMIATLQAQIAALSGGSSTSGASSVTFTRDLTLGSSGADVTALQNWLIGKGFTIPAGASGYFGAQTQSALARYQASAGITPASGYFGPLTRASVSATGGSTTTGGTTVTPKPMSGEEGQLKNIDNANAEVESVVDEGQDDVPVFGVEVEAKDSDMSIERIDVDFTLTDSANGSDNLDDYIKEVSLVVDGKTVETQDVDEADINDAGEGDFSTSADENDVYSFRFTGLDIVVDEGDTAEIYVAVSAVSNVDTADEGDDWSVLIPDDGIRAVDGAGISDTYVTGSELSEENFSVDAADAGDLSLSLDSSDNDDRVVTINENGEDDVEILRFTLESDTSDNNVDEIEIDLATTTSTTTGFATVMSRLKLEVDGKVVATESVSNGAAGGATVLFENLDLDIQDGDEVEFIVTADFKDDADTREGFTFEATVDASQIVVEDAEGDDVTVTGDVTGGEIELRTNGISVEFVSADETRNVGQFAGDADSVDFVVVFDVTANDENVYIDGDIVGGVPAPTTATDGLTWATTTDSTTGTSTTPSTSYPATLSASGSTSNDVTTSGQKSFKIDKNQTRRFTFRVSIPAGGDNVNAGVKITGIKWDLDSGDAHANLYDFNLDDLKTDTLTGLYIR